MQVLIVSQIVAGDFVASRFDPRSATFGLEDSYSPPGSHQTNEIHEERAAYLAFQLFDLSLQISNPFPIQLFPILRFHPIICDAKRPTILVEEYILDQFGIFPLSRFEIVLVRRAEDISSLVRRPYWCLTVSDGWLM